MRGAADLFVERAQPAIAARGRFSVALAGGHTPRPAYELLASESYRARVDWSRVHFFWGDERCVNPDDARSNYRLARESLLDHVSVPNGNIHRITGELPPSEAATTYQSVLERFFHERSARFDLVLLGLGADGHTASLFPGSAAVLERTRWVAGVDRSPDGLARVTLTPSLINQAALVVFLVTGAAKTAALREVLVAPVDLLRWPAQAIQPRDGEVLWLVDRQAAGELDETVVHAAMQARARGV